MKPLLPLALAALLSAPGCGAPSGGAPPVEQAWVRLPAVAGRPGAAYFTLNGGAKGATLIGITSARADRIALHESMAAGGVMRMTPLKKVAVPPRTALAFAPGGRHAMVYGIEPRTEAGGTMALTFAFEREPALTIDAKVRSAGDPPPGE